MSTLTVATYNVYLGGDLALLLGATSAGELAKQAEIVRRQLDATDFAQRATAIATILVREGVDVVGLQEVTRWESAGVDADGGVGDAEVLVDFLPLLVGACEAAGAPYDVHAVNASFDGGLPVGDRWISIRGSNVLLVRRGGALTVAGERTGAYQRSLEVATGIEDVRLPITRGWGWVEGHVDGRRVLVANTHTEAYDAEVRDAQRDELLAEVGDSAGPTVVVGDLNARPHEVGVPAPYADAWLLAGGDPESGHTFGNAPELDNDEGALSDRIDYVFVRDALVAECAVIGERQEDRTSPGRLWPSDHAGVVARLQF